MASHVARMAGSDSNSGSGSGSGSDSGSESGSDSDNDSYADFNEEYFSRVFEQEKMVSDVHRMDFYHAVVANAVGAAASPPVVLDVGTGTGCLAAWAEKAGAKKVYVGEGAAAAAAAAAATAAALVPTQLRYAFDHSVHALELAATLAEENGCEKIEFMCGHSSEFQCPEPVDIIVHEQLGDVLFDEQVVRTVTDLRDRVLRPGGAIVPARLSLRVEPVKLADDRHVPMMRDIESHGLSFACLQPLVRPQNEDPDYHHFRSSDPSLVDFFLADPANSEAAWSVDLHTVAPDATGDHKTLRFSRTVTKAGRLDALCVYFDAFGDAPGHSAAAAPTITSGPFAHRAAHWGFRLLRVPTATFAEGDVIDVEMHVLGSSWEDLNGWRWRVTDRKAKKQKQKKQRDGGKAKKRQR